MTTNTASKLVCYEGKYRLGGLWFHDQFPLPWAMEHYARVHDESFEEDVENQEVPGPYGCLNCAEYGTYNGVVIGYCSNCAILHYGGKRGCGFQGDGIEYHASHAISAFDTYLSGFDITAIRAPPTGPAEIILPLSAQCQVLREAAAQPGWCVQWRRDRWTHSPREVRSSVIYFHEGDGEWLTLQENDNPSTPCFQWRCGDWELVYEPEVQSAILEYKDGQWQPFQTSSERIDYHKLPRHIPDQEHDENEEEDENENPNRRDGHEFSAWIQRQHSNILRASNEVGSNADIENLDDENVNENDEYQNSYINNNIIDCHYEGGYNDM